MSETSLLYLNALSVEHEPHIVDGIDMGNDWEPEELAADFREQGISNLRRWCAEVILLQGSDEPLAMAAWYPIRNPELIGFAGINYVHTAKQYRKQGYGTLVVQAAEDRAREQGYQRICLSSVKSAVQFYEMIGYTNSTEQNRVNSLPWMTKDL